MKALAQAKVQLRKAQVARQRQHPLPTLSESVELFESAEHSRKSSEDAPSHTPVEVIAETLEEAPEEAKEKPSDQVEADSESETPQEERQSSGDSVEAVESLKTTKSWDQPDSPMLLQDSTERPNEGS